MGSTADFRKAFVTRLVQACDESKVIPPPYQGRQQEIAKALGVAPEAVSKWFKGVAMPLPAKMAALAALLQVDHSWLAFGLAPEMERSERKVHAREADGAVHLVIGMVLLAGGHCGTPQKSDPRSEYVDFYVTTHGSVFPVHVALGRETSPAEFELLLPKEYADVRCIGVMPVGGGKYHFLNLPLELINEHKSRKAGGIALNIVRGDASKYFSDEDAWPRIRSFSELG